MTATLPGRATARTRRLWPLAVVVLLVATAIVAVVLVRHDSTVKAPYKDSAAAGSIGLCSRAGRQVTSGSMTAKPFVWRATGTTDATGLYAAKGRSATLYAYQPRTDVDPGEWSGQQLTAAGLYTSPAHPTAAGTAQDTDLADFVTAYPAQDDGFVQLRLYLAAPDQPQQVDSYDALDIHVTGSTWHAVGGARVDCSAARSVSFETTAGSHSS